MSILIRDATVITVDRDRHIFAPGAVFIDDAYIADVGPNDDVIGRHPTADRVIDGTRKIVAPGFVSTHTHVGNTIFRGRAEDVGIGCVTGQYFPMATVMSRDERRDVGSLTYAELLRGGVTTVLEMGEEVDIYAPFVERLGVRSLMGVMIHDVDVDGMIGGEFTYDEALGEAQLAQATDFAERWHDKADGRITTLLTPNMTISSSPTQLRAVRAAADRLGLGLSIHVGWGEAENDILGKLHGKTGFEYARDNGLLAPDVIAAHCYHADAAGIDILAASGASVAHCPLMNSVRGSIAPMQTYRDRGIAVGLGIDNMFCDFFEVVRASLAMARIRAYDPMVVPAPEALALATIEAARVVGLADRIGSLEVGKRADLMVLDCRAFGMTPTLDPVRTLVYHAHARDVETVLVDGRIVVEDAALVHVDAAQLIAAAQESATAAWQRFVAKYGGYVAG